MKKSFAPLLLVLLLSSCDKGYEVRFRSYYLEKVDSVIIGNRAVIFSDIPTYSATEFAKITRGQHAVTIKTETKQFFSVCPIPGNGEGRRTLQIDAIGQITVLEEED